MKFRPLPQELILPLAMVLVGLFYSPALAQTITGQVISIGDGDTLRIKTADQKTLTTRLACIDAPEMSQSPYGDAARARLQQLLPMGQTVSLAIADTDRYGRSVAKGVQLKVKDPFKRPLK